MQDSFDKRAVTQAPRDVVEGVHERQRASLVKGDENVIATMC